MKHKFFMKSASTAAMALMLAAYAAPAVAQEAPADDLADTQKAPATDQASAEAGNQSSNDIVVTAQRREQRLQDAPVAVTALSADTLEQLNVSTTQDLMQVVPSLQVSTQSAADGGGSATFFLRGMGQQRSGNGSEPAVGIYVDDFYYPSLSGSVFDIVDLAQVEVLRGPQGTLFGRNTIGGAIRYTTKRAELGSFSGHVTGTVGNYDRYEVSGSVNVPIGDFAAIRLTGGHLDRDGYVRIQTTGDHAGGTTTDLIRAQLRVEPTPSLHADISAQYSNYKLNGFSYNVPGPMTPVPPSGGASASLPFIYNSAIAGLLHLPLYTDAYKSTCFYCQYGTSFPEFSTTEYKNLLGTIGWDFAPGLSLKSLTGWQEVKNRFSADWDSTPLPVYGGGIQTASTYAFSEELQLNGRLLDNRLNFVAGGFYYNERQPGSAPERPTQILGPGGAATTLSNRTLHSYAAFVDGSFKITDKVSLLGGYRYSEDHKGVQIVTIATGATRDSAKATFASSTWRAGLQVEWTDDIMTYANVATGFRGGGFNPYSASQSPTLRPFDPEESISYEIGARLQFLDRRITVNPTVFYVDWNKIQVQAVAIDGNNNIVVVLQNASKARSYGLELEWSASVTDNLRLFGNLAYLNLHYTKLGSATGITLDSELQRAPPITFALGAAHTLRLASGAKLISTLNYSFQDDQVSTPTDSDALHLPAYGLLNGRVEFTDPNGRFTVGVFVTNILDKHYSIGGVNFYANVGSARWDLGRPREFGATTRINF